MIYIGTTRYSTETFEQKTKWLERKEWKGCVYGLNKKLPKSLPDYEWCYVIEMINDKNEIGGIGYIKNEFCPENRSRIYDEEHFNMYVYKGTKYISREDLIKRNSAMVEYLETILFTGYTHMKRGIGITLLPYNKIILGDGKTKTRKCSNCGRQGHNKRGCPFETRKEPVILEKSQRLCPNCNKLMYHRGHSIHCPALKKNKKILSDVIEFFKSLFD